MTWYTNFFCIIFLAVSPTILFGQGDSITINTTFEETAPALSADGKTMIFQSNRDGGDKLYESQLQNNGRWSTPRALDEINLSEKSFVSIGGPSLTYDGLSLFFCARTSNGSGDMDIYRADKTGDKWGVPSALEAPINSPLYDGYPSISADGKKLFFTRLAKGNNCFKIMLSEKSDAGTWSEPIPLSRDINAGCPKSPRILSDGKTLLYCSKSDRGKNNFDLYRAILSKEGIWSDPIPFEFANSIESEEFGTIAELNELMYYVTQGNIYSMSIPPEIILNKVELTTLDVENKKSLKTGITIKDSIDLKTVIKIDSSDAQGKYQTILIPGKKYTLEISAPGYVSQTLTTGFMPNEDFNRIKKTIELKGRTRKVLLSIPDLAGTTGISADIKITDLGMNEEILLNESLSRDGKLTLNLREGNTFNIEVSTKEGRNYIIQLIVALSNFSDTNGADTIFASLSPGLILPASEIDHQELIGNKNKIVASAKETKVVLKDILFDFKSYELNDSSLIELSRVVDLLNKNPKIYLEVLGHTDDVGTTGINQKISERRAQTIVNYLVSKGINADRLNPAGFGKSRPVSSNTTEEGRAKNRRAELKIIDVN